MIMAISWGLIMGVFGFFFFYAIYLLLALIISVAESLGKDKFTWQAMHLSNSTGKSIEFESFGEMVKYGLSHVLKFDLFVTVLAIIVCVWAELT